MKQAKFHYKVGNTAWWIVLIQGIIVTLIGLLLLTSSTVTTTIILQLLGVYWLISGLLSLVSMFLHKSSSTSKLIGGILGIIAGFLVIQHPLWSSVLIPTSLLLVLGAIGIVYGIIQIFQGFQDGDLGPMALGLVSAILGIILLLTSPFFAVIIPLIAFALPFLLGICGLLGGVLLILIAFRIRRNTVSTATMTPPQSQAL